MPVDLTFMRFNQNFDIEVPVNDQLVDNGITKHNPLRQNRLLSLSKHFSRQNRNKLHVNRINRRCLYINPLFVGVEVPTIIPRSGFGTLIQVSFL